MKTVNERLSAGDQNCDIAVAEDAESIGNHLTEGLFAYDEPPLRVLFEILDDDRLVRILKVKQIARP